ncbi:unnamed protein product [Caenorhabditis bovis]|uniref:Uncharacterized protein n=1 Tax=Caenorhabditis bovis TaxID=2654633 RepID=A0A8S1EGS6_9PELO|nr:unnamed protein product [Caenorhabditis bovis]
MESTQLDSEDSPTKFAPIVKEVELRDHFNLIYIVFLFFGLSGLMPWNMFLNFSFDYYEMYKLRNGTESTWYSSNFQYAMTISAQIPKLIFTFLNVFYSTKGDLTKRLIICYSITALIIAFTLAFTYIDTVEYIAVFFFITLASIVLLNSANGIIQNSTYGMASPFPFKYTNAVIIGENSCGIFITLLAVITKAVSSDIVMQATLYFTTAFIITATSVILCALITKNNFYMRYGIVGDETRTDSEASDEANGIDLIVVFSACKFQFINIFLLFFVTLSLFPNVTMYVEDAQDSFIPKEYFMDLATFLNFNVFAFLGSLSANWVQWPGPDYIFVPVVARFWFLFYFPMCNYFPTRRRFPILFQSILGFVLSQTILAFTSGYLSSLIMMYTSRLLDEPHCQRMAGMIAAFFLILGILVGLGFSWIIHIIVVGG